MTRRAASWICLLTMVVLLKMQKAPGGGAFVESWYGAGGLASGVGLGLQQAEQGGPVLGG